MDLGRAGRARGVFSAPARKNGCGGREAKRKSGRGCGGGGVPRKE
jgi:hypothetical protein